jgi:molybdopterin molybdotransferase
MLTVEQAQALLLDLVRAIARSDRAEEVPSARATGRILFDDIRANTPWPRFAHSTMDGYVVRRAALVDKAPVSLRLTGICRPGHTPPAWPEDAHDTCMRIYTGAPLPEPTEDAVVVMQEDVTVSGDRVELRATRAQGRFFRTAGEDMHAGDLVMARGTRLDARHIALLHMLDRKAVRVARRPRVTVVTTGDELYEAGAQAPSPYAIADANGPGLSALLAPLAEEVRRTTTGDSLESTVAALRAAAETDLVLTVGGVSVGDHDYVRPALDALGATRELYKVAMRPGKPVAAATLGSTLFLSLPGNPVSAFVTFALFGAPVLRAMMGAVRPFPTVRNARLMTPVMRSRERDDFVRVRSDGAGLHLLEGTGAQASGNLLGLVAADGLARIVRGEGQTPVGAEVAYYASEDCFG